MHHQGITHLFAFVLLSVLIQDVRAADQDKFAVRECIDLTELVRSMWESDENDVSMPGAKCMSCDPVLSECMAGCPRVLHRMYERCEGITLPEGDFFDPAKTIGGGWEENYERIVISSQRCGCNAAFPRATTSLLCIAVALLALLQNAVG